MAAYVPTGWPERVQPPGTAGFEQTAVSWLLDVVPPDYRRYEVLVRHPVALATLARHHLSACIEGARQGYRSARAELGKDLPPGGLAAVLAAYQAEGRRLVAEAKAAELVSRALRGETFVPQLGGKQDDTRRIGAGDSDRGRASAEERAAMRAARASPHSSADNGQVGGRPTGPASAR